MTEIKLKERIQEIEHFDHLNNLFEIYKLREAMKKIKSKLNSMKKALKPSISSSFKYRFEAFKVIVTENNSKLRDLTSKINSSNNLFELVKSLEESKIFLKNIENEQKKLRIEPETYEITRGHYLQKMIDTRNYLVQLKNNALSYFKELKNDLIALEDQCIVLTTDKMRKNITKEDFKEKVKKVEVNKQKIEEKIAFLQVEIVDYEFDK